MPLRLPRMPRRRDWRCSTGPLLFTASSGDIQVVECKVLYTYSPVRDTWNGSKLVELQAPIEGQLVKGGRKPEILELIYRAIVVERARHNVSQRHVGVAELCASSDGCRRYPPGRTWSAV